MSDGAPGGGRPEEELLWFNGLDGRKGTYLLPPVPRRHVAELARGATAGATVDRARIRELQAWVARGEGKARRGLKEGLDPCKLDEAGWGGDLAGAADPKPMREALAPLLDLRRAQAGARQESFFREFVGDDGYRAGESKVEFLARHGAGPGPADPARVPYYLLLVGDPEAIPFSFQYQLDVQYAVGRLSFERLDEYRSYADSVVAAESGGGRKRPRACFFAPANPGDPVTGSTSTHLVGPIAAGVLRDQPGWEVETCLGAEATRGRLDGLLSGPLDSAPSFLFAACHGLGFAAGDPEQRERQGALVCQDWPGPGPGGIAREQYFAAEDVGAGARVHGLVAFCFACFGAGTPRWDDFTRAGQGERRALSSAAFLGRLPQRLLGHPQGGALAVVGHVDRAWGFSLVWPDAGPQITAFESALRRLLAGQPVGWAMDLFNQRYAELASDLAAEVEELGFGKQLDETRLADLWTASHDALQLHDRRRSPGADSPPRRNRLKASAPQPGTGRARAALYRRRRLLVFPAGLGLGWALGLVAGTLLDGELRPLRFLFLPLSAFGGGAVALGAWIHFANLADSSRDAVRRRRLRIALAVLGCGATAMLGLYLGFVVRVGSPAAPGAPASSSAGRGRGSATAPGRTPPASASGGSTPTGCSPAGTAARWSSSSWRSPIS